MARTISEIYDAIIAEKESNTELTKLQPDTDSAQKLQSNLSSTSQVAIWRLIYYVVAVAIHSFEVFLDLFNEELEETKYNLPAGTDRWYADRAKEFQLGYSLTWNGQQYVYSTEDEDAQIVAFSSAISSGRILRVKVAKDDGNELPEALGASEKTAFETYINDIGFAGTEIIVVSQAADLLKVTLRVIYDANILASDGSEVDDAATFPVEDAINTYLANLDFSGTFLAVDFVDAIQAVSGVLNIVVNTAEAKETGGTYEDILAKPNQDYVAEAGYMEIDSSFPLSGQITYVEG